MAKQTLQKKEAYLRIVTTFPEFPPYKLKDTTSLALRVLLFKDRRALHQLQQQAWLSEYLMGSYA